MTMISPDKYLEIVQVTQLIAVDLLIFNQKGEVLLGFRENRPAQHYWFVPGGRVRKGENFSQAVARVSQQEVGYALQDSQLLGVYDHIYSDNFANTDFGTQYIVFAHTIHLKEDLDLVGDEQHSSLKFFTIPELLTRSDVHQNTKNYFLPNPPNKIEGSNGCDATP